MYLVTFVLAVKLFNMFQFSVKKNKQTGFPCLECMLLSIKDNQLFQKVKQNK